MSGARKAYEMTEAQLDKILDASRPVPYMVCHMRHHGTLPIGEKNGQARLTVQKVLKMRYLFSVGVSQAEIGRRLTLPPGTVHRIVKRKAWTHVS